MKGLLTGYYIQTVYFFYHHTKPKHLQLSLSLIKQQDVNPAALEQALRRTVTPETVKVKNVKFTAQFYEEKKVWMTSDYRTVNLKYLSDGSKEEVGMTAGVRLHNLNDEGLAPHLFKSSLWYPLKLAGYHGKASLDISFSHLVDGSDPLDKWYWFIRDAHCMPEFVAPKVNIMSEEARSRIGSYCQKPLTDKELLADLAKALEKQFEFIDLLKNQRADWYTEILSSLKEYRGILDTSLQPAYRRSVLFSVANMDNFFRKSYKEDIARWEAAGGDELLK